MSKNAFIFSLIIFLFSISSCKKETSVEEQPHLTNAFALVNYVSQQFNYTLDFGLSDTLNMKFQAMTDGYERPGRAYFYVLYTDTMDTLWLAQKSKYTLSHSDLVGDGYTIDSTYNNYVLFESNNSISGTSSGIFQARFLIDSTLTILDPNSPDTIVLDSGRYSGVYIP